jgi:hypothetical protein
VDPSSLLSQLRDAHAPDAIGSWPLAPGWWLLIILTLITVVLLIIVSVKKCRATLWKREAKKAFFALREHYLSDPSETKLIALNQLMKQALCTAHNTRNYMHYTETQWAEALNSITINTKPVLEPDDIRLLSKGIYQPQLTKLDASAFQRIETWLNRLS